MIAELSSTGKPVAKAETDSCKGGLPRRIQHVKRAGLGAATATLLAACGPWLAATGTASADAPVQISAGEARMCALSSAGYIDCWGRSVDTSTEAEFGPSPVGMAGISTAVMINSGVAQVCAVLTGGSVDCIGEGRETSGGHWSNPVPVAISGVSSAVEVSVGEDFGCARLQNGTVECWGDNVRDSLGNGEEYGGGGPPVKVIGISDATAVRSSGYHSCALLAGGSVECWGEDTSGQSGNGTRQASSVPGPVSGLTDAVAIGTGFGSSCAVLSSGSVECWGAGPLGNGTYESSLVPVAVKGISNAVAVSVGVGDLEACALMSTGSVECWGANSEGQLGDDTTESSTVPVAVSGISTAVAITTGNEYSCALLADASIECWGYNSFGELGDGTTTMSDVPVRVGELIPPIEPTPAPETHETPSTPGTPSTGNPPPGGTPSSSSAKTSGHKTPRPTAATVFSLPSAKQCASRRHFTVHVRRYPGITWIGAVIKINHKRIKTIGRSHISAYVNLVGLPKGTFVLSITATASNGLKVTGTRTYHTCVPKSKAHYPIGKL